MYFNFSNLFLLIIIYYPPSPLPPDPILGTPPPPLGPMPGYQRVGGTGAGNGVSSSPDTGVYPESGAVIGTDTSNN